jgi:putative transposase
VEAAEPNQIWQSDMTKIWAGPAVGWAYLVCVIDCCTREIVGWNLSHRCRTEDALAAVEQAVLERLPEGSREENLTLTTDNGTQFTSSRFLETLGRLGITHRRTAYHHPEGNSHIERFHRSLKEEEVWTAEYRSLEESADQHCSLDRGVQSRPASPRSPKSHSARGFLGFRSCTKKRGPDCLN